MTTYDAVKIAWKELEKFFGKKADVNEDEVEIVFTLVVTMDEFFEKLHELLKG